MKTIKIKQIEKISNYLTNIWMAEDNDIPNRRAVATNERYLKKALAEITSDEEEQWKIRKACNNIKHIWRYERETKIREEFKKIGYRVEFREFTGGYQAGTNVYLNRIGDKQWKHLKK